MMYQVMFYGGLAGAVITLIISIVMFIKMNIRGAFRDLFGRRFYKIQKERKNTKEQKTEAKPITREIKLKKSYQPKQVATTLEETEWMGQPSDTVLLHDDDLLEETTLLDIEETTLLGNDETTLLDDTEQDQTYFRKEIDEMVVHSTKTI